MFPALHVDIRRSDQPLSQSVHDMNTSVGIQMSVEKMVEWHKIRHHLECLLALHGG